MTPPSGPTVTPLDNGLVAFDRDSAARTADAVRYVERQARGGAPGQRRVPRFAVNTGFYAYTSGGISAASGGTLGSGSAQLCSRNAAALTADGDTVTVYNAGGAVAAGTFLSVTWVDGDWSTSVAPC